MLKKVHLLLVLGAVQHGRELQQSTTLGGTMPSPQAARAVRTPLPADLDRAWRTVRAHLPPTPVDFGSGGPSWAEPVLKLESLQPTGSFKIRGALNALAALDPAMPVVTASAGNHGLGVAFAARALGRQATVVLSRNASPAKVSRLRRSGVDLIEVGTSFDDAEEHALTLAAEGAHYLSAYNDPEVIAGQGTIGYELERQLEGDLTVVCAVGGGGLAAGLGLWACMRPGVRIVGVESEVSTAVSTAVRAGGNVTVDIGQTLADGVAGNIEPGSVTTGLIARHVDALVTVSEAEIHMALRYLTGERGYIAEGAGAVPVAALLAGKVESRGRAVAVVSGRNITLPALASVLA
ncbi:threonine/serine dehydratase [Streptomyces kanasensis]|uniref:threonine ammonia-lyase n=1 Tax=Streptomyces kanasensis TaxID=936756 RepID=UPI0018E33AA7|nr:pyridoxal-phosphate dependent enzyme [Streptomyces kanasensis]